MRGLVLMGFLLAPNAATAPAHVPGPPPELPRVTVVGSAPTRIAVRCAPGTHVEVDSSVSPYGLRPLGERAFASLSRPDATASCVADGDNARRTVRTGDLVMRNVTSHIQHDEHGARVVVTVEGNALTPIEGDDGVYLAWPFGVVALDATCPERHADNARVIVCVDKAAVAGRGPARVRLQSAGRIAEYAQPVDLGKLFP